MIQMTIQDLAATVSTMRRLQRSYFKDRNPEVLQKCKRIETEVDEICRGLLNQPMEKPLFDLEA